MILGSTKIRPLDPLGRGGIHPHLFGSAGPGRLGGGSWAEAAGFIGDQPPSAGPSHEASLVLSQLGRSVLVHPAVNVTRAANTATIAITGESEVVIPSLHLPVQAPRVAPSNASVYRGRGSKFAAAGRGRPRGIGTTPGGMDLIGGSCPPGYRLEGELEAG